MRSLVTGGAGFIGSHLVDRLLESGFEVDYEDRLYFDETINKFISQKKLGDYRIQSSHKVYIYNYMNLTKELIYFLGYFWNAGNIKNGVLKIYVSKSISNDIYPILSTFFPKRICSCFKRKFGSRAFIIFLVKFLSAIYLL